VGQQPSFLAYLENGGRGRGDGKSPCEQKRPESPTPRSSIALRAGSNDFPLCGVNPLDFRGSPAMLATADEKAREDASPWVLVQQPRLADELLGG
jgi:hypothetical protein